MWLSEVAKSLATHCQCSRCRIDTSPHLTAQHNATFLNYYYCSLLIHEASPNRSDISFEYSPAPPYCPPSYDISDSSQNCTKCQCCVCASRGQSFCSSRRIAKRWHAFDCYKLIVGFYCRFPRSKLFVFFTLAIQNAVNELMKFILLVASKTSHNKDV